MNIINKLFSRLLGKKKEPKDRFPVDSLVWKECDLNDGTWSQKYSNDHVTVMEKIESDGTKRTKFIVKVTGNENKKV